MLIACFLLVFLCLKPRAGSGLKEYTLRFLSGCRKNRLKQYLSVLSQPRFLTVSVVLLIIRPPFALCYVVLGPICVFCLLVVLVRWWVPVQVIDCKDSSPKWRIIIIIKFGLQCACYNKKWGASHHLLTDSSFRMSENLAPNETKITYWNFFSILLLFLY